jgi:hypothetical protein
MAADRPAQLDLVADSSHVVEEGRDLAVVEPLDGELDMSNALGCGGDGIAALRLVAVRRGQAHIHMLPRLECEGMDEREEEALDPGRVDGNGGDGRLLPAQRGPSGEAGRFGLSHR